MSQTDPGVDPASLAALVALLSQGGPWGVVVVVVGLLLRTWRSGEFVSKAVHDQIMAATTQRYLDLLDRFNSQQEAIKLWRENAERATKAAEQTQARQTELLSRLTDVLGQVKELREDIRERASGNPRRGP